MNFDALRRWIRMHVRKWGFSHVLIVMMIGAIVVLMIRLPTINERQTQEDDESKQYIIDRDHAGATGMRSVIKLRSTSFGEGPGAMRPEYHWEDSSASAESKVFRNKNAIDKLKNLYSKISRPITFQETVLLLRNLSFYKQQEIFRDLQEQPYLYIQKYEKGFAPQRIRIVGENISKSPFEALNKDFPEVGSLSVNHVSPLRRFSTWFSENKAGVTKILSNKNLGKQSDERSTAIMASNDRGICVVLVVIASEAFLAGKMVSHYQQAMESLSKYADNNGYQFEIIDPQSIIEKYGSFLELLATELRNLRLGDRLKVYKSLVMLHALRKRYAESKSYPKGIGKCYSNESDDRNDASETWMIFLDADVMIANPYHRIEDIIHHSRVVLQSSACEMIAQLSLSTINTGIMMFRVSQISDILIQEWIKLSVIGLIQNTDWQHEQGWFEYLYLLYLQRYFYNLHPFAHEELDRLISYEAMNCGFKFKKGNQHIGIRDVPLPVIRGRCFMKSLSILDALPIQFHHSSMSKTVYTSSNIQKELHMCMLTGLEVANPLSSVISSIGMFNMHDWSGEDRFSPLDGSYIFQILDPRIGNSLDSLSMDTLIDIESEGEACGVVQPLFYHGKNETTRSRILSRSKHHQGGKLIPVSNDGSCTRDLMHLLKFNADDNKWLSHGWQKKSKQFTEVQSQLKDILTS